MSSSPSNQAAPDPNTIGRRHLDASEPNPPQDGGSSSSNTEFAQSHAARTPTPEPARRAKKCHWATPAITVQLDDARQSQDPKHALLHAHQVQNDRLEKMGHMLPLHDRLNALQTGHHLAAYEHALKNYMTQSVTRHNSLGVPDSVSALSVGSARASGVVPSQPSELDNQKKSSWRATSVDALDYETESQMRFNLYVQEFTIGVDLNSYALPPDIVAPLCADNEPCALRSYNDPQYGGACLWTCVSGNCMVWRDAGCLLLHGGLVPAEGDPKQFSHEMGEDHAMGDMLASWVESGDKEAFWDSINEVEENNIITD